MPVTTTFSAIRDNYVGTDSAVGIIPALTPSASPPDTQFRLCDPSFRLRDFVRRAGGSTCFRLFEFVPSSLPVDAETFDYGAREVQQVAALLVAYPPDLLAMYGSSDLNDLWRIMDVDSQQLRDALFSPGNYVAGQSAAFVEIAEPETDSDVWFLRLNVTLVYTRAQTV